MNVYYFLFPLALAFIAQATIVAAPSAHPEDIGGGPICEFKAKKTNIKIF